MEGNQSRHFVALWNRIRWRADAAISIHDQNGLRFTPVHQVEFINLFTAHSDRIYLAQHRS